MKRVSVILILLCFAICLGGILSNVQALDVNALFTTLTNELGSKVVADNGISAAEQPIKKMLGIGVAPTDIKGVLLDFISKGFKGGNLSSLMSCVTDLMKNKEAFKGAVSFVSSAMQKASAMGLSGDGLVSKVMAMVSQKKAAQDLLVNKGLGSLLGK